MSDLRSQAARIDRWASLHDQVARRVALEVIPDVELVLVSNLASILPDHNSSVVGTLVVIEVPNGVNVSGLSLRCTFEARKPE